MAATSQCTDSYITVFFYSHVLSDRDAMMQRHPLPLEAYKYRHPLVFLLNSRGKKPRSQEQSFELPPSALEFRDLEIARWEEEGS
ncbi:hypothetical protein GUJ93_ZPchr0011g28439 [Zizania palustris]|uniref:Uncharacterized protein n=1 Tax=Zizania palustris TaxID=103762 RepID=A0A8J5WIP4_ZIZPA|nr:hypothetical protein GUJ93_ZPchr0011g28439 [Zizania palustris]